jgi:hypothetical protein
MSHREAFMTEGFASIWVEQRGAFYHAIVETGDGKRTVSPPFRTERAANFRAEQALAAIQRMQPNAEVVARDQNSAEKLAKIAIDFQADSDARHEVPEA